MGIKGLVGSAAFIGGMFSASLANAHDSDLEAIVDAINTTPCSEVQVLVAKNVAAIRWAGGNMRYLYDEDIRPIEKATLSSGKRIITVDKDFEIPTMSDPNWVSGAESLSSELNQIFQRDFKDHPPSGC